MKKQITMIMILALMLGMVGILPARQAKADAACADVAPQVMTTLVGFNATAAPIWSVPELKPTNDPTAQYFAKFTITEKCVYAFSLKMATQGTHETDANCYLMSEQNGTTWINAINYQGTSPNYGVLEPGTYYLKLESGLMGICKHQANVYFGIVPYDQAIALTQKTVSNGKEVEVSYTDFVTNGEMSASLYEGVVDENHDGSMVDYLYKDKSCTVKKNGTYTLKINFRPSTLGAFDYYYTFKVTGVDTAKPTVKGIKNNGSYKKKAAFYVKDASGIKSVKAGSKKLKLTKVKKGKYKGYYKAVISKKGKYTIKVSDKYGNVKTIKIRVK